jgi:hypothetical protein
MKDFSYLEQNKDGVYDRVVHLYCPGCKGHQWKNKWWTVQEWLEFINEGE